jgi:dihydroorotate dehydrogenase subfamily 1
MELYLKKAKREANIPIIASIMGRNIEEWIKLGQMVEEAGADMIELNISGPHITEITETMGRYFGGVPERAAEVTSEVKNKVSIPIIAKLTPENPNLSLIAQTVKDAGADGVTIMNAVIGLEIDIKSEAPILHSSYCGWAGPWLRPIGLRWVSKVAQEVDIPISGLSGVVTWEDVIKYILVGSTTVQISTGLMVKGHRLISESIRGLENFMKEKGYNSIEEMRGKALKNIISLRDVYWDPLGSVIAFVDENICNGCGACVNSCFHNAINLEEGIAIINNERCEGCGLCADICPVDAIIIKKIKNEGKDL